MTISIIGAGNMGSALCQSLLNKKICSAKNITISDKNEVKLKQLKSKLKVKTSTDNANVLDCDFLFLAIKPQSFLELAEEISGKIPKITTVISIMAGAKLDKIAELLLHEKLVRAMPNTPALVNEGVTGWVANNNISPEEKTEIQKILESTGYAIELENEDQIDKLTAISGCGPGFFFYIFDQWDKASQKLKLPDNKNKEILIKTLKGSLALLESSEDSAYTLTQKVASKGGATEQGLQVLADSRFEEIMSKMIDAAYNRCKEL